ncbi:MAG: hypothetical protein K1X55_02095 [Chitinophagales bacterium]|nr:hypothetical protein [Chitinophagales bacterium]
MAPNTCSIYSPHATHKAALFRATIAPVGAGGVMSDASYVKRQNATFNHSREPIFNYKFLIKNHYCPIKLFSALFKFIIN